MDILKIRDFFFLPFPVILTIVSFFGLIILLPKRRYLSVFIIWIILSVQYIPSILFKWLVFTERCFGQGSGIFADTHTLLCYPDYRWGMSWWTPVLMLIEASIYTIFLYRCVKDDKYYKKALLMVLIYQVASFFLLYSFGLVENTPSAI